MWEEITNEDFYRVRVVACDEKGFLQYNDHCEEVATFKDEDAAKFFAQNYNFKKPKNVSNAKVVVEYVYNDAMVYDIIMRIKL